MSRECMIVRDLLPLYAEGLTSSESSEFVKAHLDGCEECREELEKIKSEISLGEASEEELAGLKRLKAKLVFKRILIGVVSSLALVAMLMLFYGAYVVFIRGFDAASVNYGVSVEQDENGEYTLLRVHRRDEKPIRVECDYRYVENSDGEQVLRTAIIKIRETPFDLLPGDSVFKLDFTEGVSDSFICDVYFEDKRYVIKPKDESRLSNFILVFNSSDSAYSGRFIDGDGNYVGFAAN